MTGFVSVPDNYVASVGGVASTIMGDLMVPVALVIGLFLVIWLIRQAVEWFDDMKREARIAKIAGDLGLSPAQVRQEEQRRALEIERRELSALELEEAEENYT